MVGCLISFILGGCVGLLIAGCLAAAREKPETDIEVVARNDCIEGQCRYLEEMATKVGVSVVVEHLRGREFLMRLSGCEQCYVVTMEEPMERFLLKAWKLLNVR